MAFTEPKVNWTESDYFNAEDYNRIVSNLEHLKGLSEELFQAVIFLPMERGKNYDSFIYAREINAIEDNLEALNLNTYKFSLGEKPVYVDNGRTPMYSEFNRIESAMMKLYTTMKVHKDNLPKLAFFLGGQKGIKV